jgi:hypothetical protein
MRLWAHTIWHAATNRVLQTCGPKENDKFEKFLHEWGEEKTAYAWYLYCNADPAPYNLEPVKHVDEFTSKKGNRVVRELENQAAITRFPLSAFLAVSEGYIVRATIEIDEVLAQPKGERHLSGGLRNALTHLKTKTNSLTSQW